MSRLWLAALRTYGVEDRRRGTGGLPAQEQVVLPSRRHRLEVPLFFSGRVCHVAHICFVTS